MPAASEVALPRTWRPAGVRFAVIGFGVMLLVVCVACWFGFDESVRERFSWLQRITVLAMGAGLATCGWALARARVTADAESLTVVNGFRTRRLEWAEVVAVHLPAGAPWATLDLADGTEISAMALQGSDGRGARDGVRELRALIDRQPSDDS
ncbi:PH domain-containing protein [Nocardioides exalbidus]|uniref:PH domain-containing protein n=1 Tax=Nocardioides exalbidus TaxID=402596 RepID=A0A1H4YK51_9ACTN|nr:PH domain-containing protein [Nocardioides exalbidus]SED18273.1 PH domain-containing protein [Nocardioides exalbidus]